MTVAEMDPGGPLIVHPLKPHQLHDEVTTREGLFTLCHFGVARVEFSADGGRAWSDASVEARTGHRWQRFAAKWAPSSGGTHVLMSRAWTAAGECQPMSGRRNAVHAVSVLAS